jgi:hypothetical protein
MGIKGALPIDGQSEFSYKESNLLRVKVAVAFFVTFYLYGHHG